MLLHEPVQIVESVRFVARLPLPLTRFPPEYWQVGKHNKERFITFEVRLVRSDRKAVLAQPLSVKHGLSLFNLSGGKLQWVTYNINENDLHPLAESFLRDPKMVRQLLDGREFEVE